MAMSLRRDLLNAVVARLELIQAGDTNEQGATFETDAGDHIDIGDTIELGQDDPDDLLLVVPGEATKRSDGQKKIVEFLIEVQALVKVTVDNAWARVELMLSDIERAIETPDQRLANQPFEWMSTRTVQREPGSTTAGVGVTYKAVFQQTWGLPEMRKITPALAVTPRSQAKEVYVGATFSVKGGRPPYTFAAPDGTPATGTGSTFTTTYTTPGTKTVTVTDGQALTTTADVEVSVPAVIPAPPDPEPVPTPQPVGVFDWIRDMVYLMSFRVPHTAVGLTSFAYNAYGLAFNPNSGGLFLSARSADATVGGVRIAEITIPTVDNAIAAFIQSFAEPTEGAYVGALVPGTPLQMTDYAVVGGRLFGCHHAFYDALNVQSKSHWSRPVDLSITGDVVGMFGLTSSPAIPGGANPVRFTNMGLMNIPAGWQGALGGDLLTGGEAPTISGGASNGPAGFGWDSAAFGSGQAVLPLLYYTQANPLSPWNQQSDLWNGTTAGAGGFIAGGSLIYVQRQGVGRYGYGVGTSDPALDGTPTGTGSTYWYDPAMSSHGGHAYPYVYRVLAYDIATLIANRATPWINRPYATWTFEMPYATPAHPLSGLAVDEGTKKVYIAQGAGDGTFPRIHVFQGSW